MLAYSKPVQLSSDHMNHVHVIALSHSGHFLQQLIVLLVLSPHFDI